LGIRREKRNGTITPWEKRLKRNNQKSNILLVGRRGSKCNLYSTEQRLMWGSFRLTADGAGGRRDFCALFQEKKSRTAPISEKTPEKSDEKSNRVTNGTYESQ